MSKKVKYYLNKDGEFIIENYHLAKPFSSFLPGIAGTWGIPIWAFYVNRGQAIASFGIKNKDHPVMEFQPANKAYYLTPLVGFRTFIKSTESKKHHLYDAFSGGATSAAFNIENMMTINPYELKLKEINRTLGIEVDIEYFSIPNDNYGALARKVTVTNTSKKNKSLEILDGMPQIIPYGLSNFFLKELARTVEAWMGVENLENSIPYLRLKVDPSDRPKVLHIKEGNFYLAHDKKGLIKPIVDPKAIFGEPNNFTYPREFMKKRYFGYPKDQLTKSKTPCCMSYLKCTLKPGRSHIIYTLAGNMDNLDKLKANARRIADRSYFKKKQQENAKLISSLQSTVFTHSSSKEFDFYCGQNFLDNLIRGGYPLSLEHPSGKTHVQVFSRKHGDLERDYNRFLVEPTYFSQGNGNYRDVNQNRRCNIWFNPELKEESIYAFFNFIQIDGYNPLVIKPERFRFNKNFRAINRFFDRQGMKRVKAFLKQEFTPGELFFFLEQSKILLRGKKRELLKVVLDNTSKTPQAEHGEGFWIDHWHYCLDLLETYISLYPESLYSLLLKSKNFTFFDNTHIVRPRSQKHVLHNDNVRQFGSVIEDHHKIQLIKRREGSSHLSRTKNGLGSVYRTTLIAKMVTVIANKFASLDAFGVGIEMEADKPNWYDSLNGLPGLLGSSTCETFELKRWIIFLKRHAKEMNLDNDYKIYLPTELKTLLTGLDELCKKRLDTYRFWDKASTLKEGYREKTLMGFKGLERAISIKELNDIFDRFLSKINTGLARAYDKKQKLYYGYFINEVIDYKLTKRSEHMQHVKALKFKQRPLPLFLEAMVHCLRVQDKKARADKIYQMVRRSPLYDKKLKMYKVNASLKDMPEEIGRNRVFTPGWLENESIWLHMEYKYLLELLKSGLYKQFYEDFKNVLIPFQDAKRYGRSILENSSFIVSSAFPKKALHGSGFVARLSGSTAEFINIWLIMCTGHEPFYLSKDNKLSLELNPILPGWLFSKVKEGDFPKNTFSFKFLNKTLVTYYNPKRKDTFGPNGAKAKEIHIKPFKGKEVLIKSSVIPPPYSYEVRHGKIASLYITL